MLSTPERANKRPRSAACWTNFENDFETTCLGAKRPGLADKLGRPTTWKVLKTRSYAATGQFLPRASGSLFFDALILPQKYIVKSYDHSKVHSIFGEIFLLLENGTIVVFGQRDRASCRFFVKKIKKIKFENQIKPID